MSEPRLCQDCNEPIPYGVGWGSGGVHAKCRAMRAQKAAKDLAKLTGRLHGSNKHGRGL